MFNPFFCLDPHRVNLFMLCTGGHKQRLCLGTSQGFGVVEEVYKISRALWEVYKTLAHLGLCTTGLAFPFLLSPFCGVFDA